MTHHPHAHEHAHAPQIRSTPSILRLSAAERLAVIAVVVIALWAGIFWAMS
jgi:hypothetical protein